MDRPTHNIRTLKKEKKKEMILKYKRPSTLCPFHLCSASLLACEHTDLILCRYILFFGLCYFAPDEWFSFSLCMRACRVGVQLYCKRAWEDLFCLRLEAELMID